MKASLIFVALASGWVCSVTLWAQSSPQQITGSKTREQLVADIRDTHDGGTSARAALKTAAERKEIEVVVAGLTGANYDIRWESLNALKLFSAPQRKEALLAALRDPSLWKKILGGELASAQYVYFGDFATALKEFGIDATRDDLSDPAARNRVTQRLAGFYIPPDK